MRTSSAKAKGKRAAVEIKEALHKYAPALEQADIWVTPSGVPGVDVNFSPLAKKVYPYAIEAKNQEAIQIWAALKQCEERRTQGTPLLIFRRNRSELYACLKLEDFLRIAHGK